MCFDRVHTSLPPLVPVSSSIKPSLYWLHILEDVVIHWSVVNIAGATLFKNHLFLSSDANSCSPKVEPCALLSFLMGLV